MNPKEFVTKFLPFAKESEQKTGISAVFTLAQAAIESGWGKHAPGNMFFGVKDTDGLNGNEQKILTTEYSLKSNLKPKDLGLTEFVKVEPVTIKGIKRFKYVGHAYFRKYNTPAESFTDHVQFFNENKRYNLALKVKSDPVAFAEAIAKAGYATGPTYADLLKSVIKTIQRNL